MAPQERSGDMVRRGSYGSSPYGTAVFVGLRALDGFVLQRALQVLNPIPTLCAKLGFSIPPPPPSGGAALSMSAHDLTPFQAIIWGLSIASACKHIFWILYISKEQMYPDAAVIIALFNTVFNSINTLAFSFASVNPTWSARMLYISVPLSVAGLLIETGSELQRKSFKDDPKNQGKPYSGGLFGYARSINYMGYMCWRSAMAMGTGGIVWGAAVAAFFSFDFCSRAIPSMDEYCQKKYGAQWTEVKRKVPYAFFPGVY